MSSAGSAAPLGLLRGAAPHGLDELHLQGLVRFPQLAVVDVVDAIPQRGVARARGPVRPEMAVVDLPHLGRQPRRHVHAVGDVADRHAILAAFGIERTPHRARDLAVERRDGVGAMRRLQRQDRHAEGLVAVRRVDAAQAEETLAIDAKRFAQRAQVLVDEGGAEAVVAGRHGRVRREDDLRRDAAQGLPRVDALDDHTLAHDLERGERAVALVEMEDAWRDAERRQRAHAADAEQQLLPDADAVVAAVEPRRQLAILGLVAVDVRIEQEERVAPDRRAATRAPKSFPCGSRPRRSPARPERAPAGSAASGGRRRCSPRAASRRDRGAAGNSPGRNRDRRRRAESRDPRRS